MNARGVEARPRGDVRRGWHRGALFGAVTLAAVFATGCMAPFEALEPGSSSKGASLLIEVVERNPWTGDTRFVVTSGTDHKVGTLRVTGGRKATRRLTAHELSVLKSAVEDFLLGMDSSDDGCEDCTEYLITARLGDRGRFAVIRRSEPRDALGFVELMSVLKK